MFGLMLWGCFLWMKPRPEVWETGSWNPWLARVWNLPEPRPCWLKSNWNMMKHVKSIESNRRRSQMRCNSVCKSNYKPTRLALSSLGPRSRLRWSFTATGKGTALPKQFYCLGGHCSFSRCSVKEHTMRRLRNSKQTCRAPQLIGIVEGFTSIWILKFFVKVWLPHDVPKSLAPMLWYITRQVPFPGMCQYQTFAFSWSCFEWHIHLLSSIPKWRARMTRSLERQCSEGYFKAGLAAWISTLQLDCKLGSGIHLCVLGIATW